jgi:hypothetical protein
MMDPSPNSFSIWESVFLRAGLPSRKGIDALLATCFFELAFFLEFDFSDFVGFAIRPFTPAAITMAIPPEFPGASSGWLLHHHRSSD